MPAFIEPDYFVGINILSVLEEDISLSVPAAASRSSVFISLRKFKLAFIKSLNKLTSFVLSFSFRWRFFFKRSTFATRRQNRTRIGFVFTRPGSRSAIDISCR